MTSIDGYNITLSKLNFDVKTTEEVAIPVEVFEEPPVVDTTGKPFDITLFADEVKNNIANDNINRIKSSNHINAYDICSSCIRSVVMRLIKIPVSVSDITGRWLPIQLRNEIGNVVHDFILSSSQFTEKEVTLKCESLNVSCRLDGLIGSNVIVEIKTCSYNEYKKIIQTRTPRTADFYQLLLYKYLLENHLDEIKSAKNPRTAVPKLNKYDINIMQFLYVAHEIIPSSNTLVKEIKDEHNSKNNQFYFLTSICLNINDSVIDSLQSHISYIVDIIKEINGYVDKRMIPSMDHRYVDKTKCYFCLYRTVCDKVVKYGEASFDDILRLIRS